MRKQLEYKVLVEGSQYLDSVTDSFNRNLRLLIRQGYEVNGNTELTVIPNGRFVLTADLVKYSEEISNEESI